MANDERVIADAQADLAHYRARRNVDSARHIESSDIYRYAQDDGTIIEVRVKSAGDDETTRIEVFIAEHCVVNVSQRGGVFRASGDVDPSSALYATIRACIAAAARGLLTIESFDMSDDIAA